MFFKNMMVLLQQMKTWWLNWHKLQNIVLFSSFSLFLIDWVECVDKYVIFMCCGLGKMEEIREIKVQVELMWQWVEWVRRDPLLPPLGRRESFPPNPLKPLSHKLHIIFSLFSFFCLFQIHNTWKPIFLNQLNPLNF